MGTSSTQLWAREDPEGQGPVLLMKGYVGRCFSRTHQGALLSHFKSPGTQRLLLTAGTWPSPNLGFSQPVGTLRTMQTPGLKIL